jgi:hypothetical protein
MVWPRESQETMCTAVLPCSAAGLLSRALPPCPAAPPAVLPLLLSLRGWPAHPNLAALPPPFCAGLLPPSLRSRRPPEPGRALLAPLRRVCVTMPPPVLGVRGTMPPPVQGRAGGPVAASAGLRGAPPAEPYPRQSPGPAQLWPPSLGIRLDLPNLPPCHPRE